MASASTSVARLAKSPSASRTFSAPRSARPSRSAAQFRVSAFKVTFNMPHGVQQVIDVDPDTTIMDAAISAGIKLPKACQAGACGACAGRAFRPSAHIQLQLPEPQPLVDASLDTWHVCARLQVEALHYATRV